jgi:hypothetical protein
MNLSSFFLSLFRVYDYHCVNHPRSTQCLGTNIYIYTSENKLNQTVLELDFRAVKYICKTRIHVQSLIDVQSSNPCSIPTSQTSVPQIYVLFSNYQNGAVSVFGSLFTLFFLFPFFFCYQESFIFCPFSIIVSKTWTNGCGVIWSIRQWCHWAPFWEFEKRT